MLATREELQPRARELAGTLAEMGGFETDVVDEQSEPGSGSAPGVFLDTYAVRVTHASLSADELADQLRRADPPLFVRIKDGAVLLDPRTLLPGDEQRVLAAFESVE